LLEVVDEKNLEFPRVVLNFFIDCLRCNDIFDDQTSGKQTAELLNQAQKIDSSD